MPCAFESFLLVLELAEAPVLAPKLVILELVVVASVRQMYVSLQVYLQHLRQHLLLLQVH
jgi:hypothetical protein